MGYRSEVALAISKELMPRFLTVFAKCPEAQAMVFKDHNKMVEDYDGEGTFFVHWSGIKWYDSYPEVRAITDFVSMSTDYLSSICEDVEEFQRGSYVEHFRFVRMGEDNEDIEEEGWLCSGDIGIRRELSF